MFEGYAGTSESGFRQEVEAEEAIARGEKLADLVVSHEHRTLTGPAAADVEARLAAFERHITFEGKVITDAARMRRIMQRYDPHVYHGKFVTCGYNRDRALCRRSTDDTDAPSLPNCKPLLCRNAALTAENRGALADHLGCLDQALDRGDFLAPYVRDRLRQQRDDVTNFLALHTPEGPK
jgi:hypothetical protein